MPRVATTISNRDLQRLLVPYSSLDHMSAVVAYAEARSIMLAWATSAPGRDALDLARRAVDHALAPTKGLWHPSADVFAHHVQKHIRSFTASQLFRIARKAGDSSWAAQLAPGQVGDVPGVELMFHEMGDRGTAARRHDSRVRHAAQALADHARSRARQLALAVVT